MNYRCAIYGRDHVDFGALNHALQTLNIVERTDDKAKQSNIVIAQVAVAEATTSLKRTRSKSTLGSDTSSDDPLKQRTYDIKMQRAAKRPRLTSTKMDEVQIRQRLAVKRTPFRPPTQNKPSSLTSAPSMTSVRSSSSTSQSDDDHGVIPHSPATSTDDDPMDLIGNRDNDVEGGSAFRSSPISSVTSGIKQISVATTAPTPYYGRNYRQAKDIPTELHDAINNMDNEQRERMGKYLLDIFEAQMMTNTAHDEPYAPPIRIYNNIDDEPTPAFEFYYSNLMWHTEGVPPPDYQGLKGCDCVGGCNPKSETCACIKRQRLQFQDHDNDPHRWLPEGFMYNEKGILVQSNFPIIECNDACRCSDDCMNRVCGSPPCYQVKDTPTTILRLCKEDGNVSSTL